MEHMVLHRWQKALNHKIIVQCHKVNKLLPGWKCHWACNLTTNDIQKVQFDMQLHSKCSWWYHFKVNIMSVYEINISYAIKMFWYNLSLTMHFCCRRHNVPEIQHSSAQMAGQPSNQHPIPALVYLHICISEIQNCEHWRWSGVVWKCVTLNLTTAD